MTFLTLVYHGAGFQQEPHDLSGLAKVTAKTLFRGTPSMTREAISKRFDLLGAIVETNVSETDFYVTISCFSGNLAQVLGLVHEVIQQAHFPENELETLKKQELNSLEAALQEPDHVLSSANEYSLFGRNAMGKLGSRSAIQRISRNNVTAYMEKTRGTGVLYFTAITDVSKEEMHRHIRLFSDDRPNAGFFLKPEVEYVRSNGREAVVIHSKDATNDRLIWSHRGLKAADDRRFDLSLIIDALGSFEGFLFDELRNKHGWCYGAYAYVMPPTTRAGRVAYYSDPTSETSQHLIPALLGHLKVFPLERNYLDRFADRTETFKNRYAYQLDIKKKLSNEVHRDRYGIPILGQEEYNRRIDSVTPESAGKVIREVFDIENLMLVFYGDAARLTNILRHLDSKIEIEVLEKEVLVE